MGHWSEEVEHNTLTEETRPAFNKAMEKFPTQADAAIGYMELQKTAGVPFKLPDAMDKIPEASRGDFTTQARNLLGIKTAKSLEDLNDLNLKAADGLQTDDDFAAAFKQFVVDSGMQKSVAQKSIDFYNNYSSKRVSEYDTQNETDRTARATAVKAGLLARFGTTEEVDKQSDLMERAIRAKTTPEEYEQMGKAMVSGVMEGNPVVARILHEALAPLAAESSVKAPGGGTPATSVADPDLGCPSQFATGLCTAEENAAWKARQ